jgi:hypothetical protein
MFFLSILLYGLKLISSNFPVDNPPWIINEGVFLGLPSGTFSLNGLSSGDSSKVFAFLVGKKFFRVFDYLIFDIVIGRISAPLTPDYLFSSIEGKK